MKMLVCNNINSSGKSTLVKQFKSVLYPRARVIQLEGVNGSPEVENAKVFESYEIKDAMRYCIGIESYIIDAGASGYESTVEELSDNPALLNNIDRVVLPVTTEHQKNKADTVDCVETLTSLGIQPEKIRIIYNSLSFKEAKQNKRKSIFSSMNDELRRLGVKVDTNAYMRKSDIFDLLEDQERTLIDALEDQTDYGALIEIENDERKLVALHDLQATQSMAPAIGRRFQEIAKYVNDN